MDTLIRFEDADWVVVIYRLRLGKGFYKKILTKAQFEKLQETDHVVVTNFPAQGSYKEAERAAKEEIDRLKEKEKTTPLVFEC